MHGRRVPAHPRDGHPGQRHLVVSLLPGRGHVTGRVAAAPAEVPQPGAGPEGERAAR